MKNELADRFAALKIEMEALEAELNAVKAQILETGSDVIEGERFKVLVNLAERTSISAKEAEKVLAPEVFKSLTKTTTYSTVRFKAL